MYQNCRVRVSRKEISYATRIEALNFTNIHYPEWIFRNGYKSSVRPPHSAYTMLTTGSPGLLGLTAAMSSRQYVYHLYSTKGTRLESKCFESQSEIQSEK